MKHSKLLVLSILILPAISFGSVCSELKECVEKVSEITKQKYYYNADLKGKVQTTDNLKLNKKNADNFLSSILALNGYSKLKQQDKTWVIIPSRDIRYNPTPIITNLNDLPNNDDYHMFIYKLKFPENSSSITRHLRPFMSRYGRVINHKYPATIYLNDTANNIKRLVEVIKTMDQKLSKKEILEMRKENKAFKKRMKEKMKKS